MKRTSVTSPRPAAASCMAPIGEYKAVSSDTRTLAGGDLFIALRGPRYNANEFVSGASTAGAAGALVDTLQPVAIPQIVVPDTQVALGKGRSVPGARSFRFRSSALPAAMARRRRKR